MRGGLIYLLLYSFYWLLWNSYIMFTTRFDDQTLRHSSFLLLYVFGLAAMVVHTDELRSVRGFALGCIVSHVGLILMFGAVSVHHERARPHVFTQVLLDALSIVGLAIAAAYSPTVLEESENPPTSVVVALVLTSFVGLTFVMWSAPMVPPSHFIMINIDHISDRQGCMVMVMLGESIVSATVRYRSLDVSSRSFDYYGSMALNTVLVFCLALLYYHMQPPREYHAARLSKKRGILAMYAHVGLFPSFLAVGVGVKLIVSTVTADDVTDRFLNSTQVWFIFGAVSLSLAFLLVIRLAHFAGKHPAPTDPPPVRRVKWIWWIVIAVSTFVPLVVAAGLCAGSASDTCSVAPLHAAGGACGIVVALVLAENSITHYLHEVLGPNLFEAGPERVLDEPTSQAYGQDTSDERVLLRSTYATDYHAVNMQTQKES